MTATRTVIGILLFDGVEELDAVGPWEVLRTAEAARPDALHCFTMAETAAAVRCANGMRILPDYDLARAPAIDVIVVPGGEGTHGVIANPALLDWISETAAACRWVTSVCTGARVLLAAGPAKGKRITTYHSAIAELRATGEAAEVVDGERWVRDGNLVSAAGVSAGIDMALWLVGQLFDAGFAREIQQAIEYDPAPPYGESG
jgi:transcriptional regulator GlxA family with amidase domain